MPVHNLRSEPRFHALLRKIGIATSPSRTHRIVGRADALAALSEALESTSEQGVLITVAGEAGIGAVQIKDGRIHLALADADALEQRFSGAARRPRLISKELAVVDDGFPQDNPPGLALFLRRLLRP